MKRIFIIFPLIILLFCSWVDRDTIDTYTGDITYVYSQYDVTRLSGDIEYFFDDYVHLGLSSAGYLYNASPDTISGVALIGGTEYAIQMTSLGGLQIEQTYITNTYTRTTWVNYNLRPDVLPSSFDLSELAPIFIVFLIFMIIPLMFYRGILL